MANLVVGVAGAALGAALGPAGAVLWGMNAAQLGFIAGSAIGSVLFAPKGPDGPRLNDLSVQVSTYGQSLPRAWGTTRRSGNVIWAADLVERAKESSGGGKGGGPTQTTFSYTCSFAVSLGEGPVVGIRRLWADGKLIYDSSATNTGVIQDFIATSFVIYTGSETQGVDPTIQAAMTNTPAYRGQCYFVFTDLELEKFGNRIPYNISAEVIQNGTGTVPATVSIGSGEDYGAIDPNTGYLWTVQAGDPQSTVYVNNPVTNTVVKTIVIEQNDADRITYVPTTNEFWLSHDEPGSFDTDIAIINAGSMTVSRYIEWTASPTFWPGAIGYNSTADVVYVASTNGVGMGLYYFTSAGVLQTEVVGIDDWVFDIYDLPEAGLMATNGWPKHVFLINASTHQLVAKLTGTDFGSGAIRLAWDKTRRRIMMVSSTAATFCYVIDVDSLTITKTTIESPPSSGFDTIIYHAVQDKFIGTAGAELVVINAGTFAVESSFSQPISARYITAQRWYNDAVLAVSSDNIVRRMYFAQNRLSTNQVNLSTIITDLSVDVGMTAGDIDVTDLTGMLCDGFLLARQGSARSAIEQLMMAYQFDAVESGGKVKFVRRGSRPSVTIDADNLAAHEYGQDVPTVLPIKRADEVELPRSITVKYMNIGADHQIGAQSATRQTVRSMNDVAVDLPVAMSDSNAKAIADAALYSAWSARSTAKFSTTMKYADKEPTDLVTVEGNLIRITKRSLRGNIIDFEGAFDSGMVFAGGASAGAAQSVTQTIGFRSKTAIELMDIPLLRDQDNDAGFYAAASGYSGQTWDGCVIFKSSDGGSSWDEIATLTTAATVGASTTALGDFSQNVFDEFNTVTVTLTSGTLASVTELAVLNGSNAALLGAEIFQFRTATLNGDGTYTLSGLLRGRKGSPTGGHVIGDRFVLLNTTSVRRIDMSTSDLGIARLYKAVTIGDTLASTSQVSFTNTAIGLECLSGVYLGGGRDASWNLKINWVRRTRIGGEWRDYVDSAVGETSESYEVEIWDNTFSTLKRTITGITSPTTSYTQGDTDFSTTVLAPLKTPTLTNPGAETGNITGWTVEKGSFDTRNTSPAPYAGSWYFDGGTGLYVARQRVDLLALGWTAAELDGGTLGAQIAAQMAGSDGVNDPGSLGLRYLDTAQATLGEYFSPEYTTNQTWVARNFARPMPVGTRYVDLLLSGRRTSGTNNDAYFDDVSIITGTYSGLPSTVGVKVYQLSATVGRGFVVQGVVFGGDDAYWSNVVSLLHMNGTNGSTTFTDQTGKLWTAKNSAQITTAQSKFGGASGLFNSSPYITTPTHADWDFGAGDFTIECWARLSNIAATRQIITKRVSSSVFAPYSMFTEVTTGKPAFYASGDGSTWGIQLIGSTGVGTTSFKHWAVTRSGITFRLFIDGIEVASANMSGPLMTNTASVSVGAAENGNFDFDGYIDEMRITKGIARYIADFTPPTKEFPME